MLSPGKDALGHATYERHRPEQTLLYQLVEKHYPALVEQLEAQGKSLPTHVHREFESYLKCGRLEHGLLRVRCDKCHFEQLVAFSCKKRGFCPSCGARRMAESAALLADEVFPDVPLRQWVISFPFPLRYLFAAHPQAMGKVLGIIYRAISTHLIHKAELQLKDGATGAVTLIQRFGSALNLNIHFHTLFLDGVYIYRDNGPPRFQRVKAPTRNELEDLVQLISQRVGRCLERQGLLEQDADNAWLELGPAEDTDAMPQILGSSITYRIAVGPQQGRKAFMIRTIRPLDKPDPGLERVAKASGFSLHAGVSCEGHQKDKRERIFRYIARPPVAVPRLSLSSTGKVVYTLKTPYRDGTTQVAFDPMDFIARLAALVPKPRVNLTRYHGVIAPNHRWRGQITPAKRGKGMKPISNTEARTPAERHAAMTWAQRLKRVFNIDIEVCNRCGGSVSVIACIEDQNIIDRILAHIRDKEQTSRAPPPLTPPSRAPPETLPLFAAKEPALSQIHQQERRRVVTAENLSARSAAGCSSKMNGYELQTQRCESSSGAIGKLFVKM